MLKATKQKQSAFTIVELLIVIVVIAILATISIVSYSGIQERARVTRANSELALLKKAILIARVNQGKTLLEVTGSGCTGCVNTQAQYELSLDNITAASGADVSGLKRGDPWGNMYYIDENEGEGGSCANKDWIGVNPAHTGVNGITIPFYSCP